ncbi:ATP-binding protein [Anaerococcus sp. NML200574]|uniref:ATP-binding protein n=1 Tax=Anaerococcus sp. NML200574 TaxID=2954486 RepID=UPI002238EC39|nr:ATP-binding protein [Anaerococcus sp. NML200574]MCW6677705.1 ATP-binding protein [Anaerococcus sp. NML200574]
MKLYMENIGKLANTEISIDGITVIAGKNGTGKSTVSKSLFSIFSGFYDYKEKIIELRNYFIMREIRKQTSSFFLMQINQEKLSLFFHSLYQNRSNFVDNRSNLKDLILHFISENVSEDYLDFDDASSFESNINDEMLDGIVSALFIEESDLLEHILDGTFEAEFNGQIKKISNEDMNAKVSIDIKDKLTSVKIDGDGNITIYNPVLLTKRIVYIDDPYIIDSLQEHRIFRIPRYNFYNHTDDLIDLLDNNSPESILIDDSLGIINEHLKKVGQVNIIKERNSYLYNFSDSEEKINVKNASTGLKAFLIIKLLFERGSLQQNGTIILDEPETHLHPDWQLIFAELIVLLNKHLGMHILINSHSPYFIRALEVYSKKHGINDKLRFYYSFNNDDTGLSEIKEVTDSVEEIYSALAVAFDILEEESDRDD